MMKFFQGYEQVKVQYKDSHSDPLAKIYPDPDFIVRFAEIGYMLAREILNKNGNSQSENTDMLDLGKYIFGMMMICSAKQIVEHEPEGTGMKAVLKQIDTSQFRLPPNIMALCHQFQSHFSNRGTYAFACPNIIAATFITISLKYFNEIENYKYRDDWLRKSGVPRVDCQRIRDDLTNVQDSKWIFSTSAYILKDIQNYAKFIYKREYETRTIRWDGSTCKLTNLHNYTINMWNHMKENGLDPPQDWLTHMMTDIHNGVFSPACTIAEVSAMLHLCEYGDDLQYRQLRNVFQRNQIQTSTFQPTDFCKILKHATAFLISRYQEKINLVCNTTEFNPSKKDNVGAFFMYLTSDMPYPQQQGLFPKMFSYKMLERKDVLTQTIGKIFAEWHKYDINEMKITIVDQNFMNHLLKFR